MIHNWIFFVHGKHWFQRFLKKGYGHILILARDDFNWIWIHPFYNYLSISILNFSIKDDVVQKVRETYKIKDCFYIERDEHYLKSKFRMKLFNPINCVAFTKYYLGINRKWILSPWQLAKYLSSNRYCVEYLSNKRYLQPTMIKQCRRI